MSDGRRNTDLTKVAGLYRREGCSEEEIFRLISAVNAQSVKPLDQSEVRSIARSVSNYPPNPKGSFHDIPLSKVVAERICSSCRFAPEAGWRTYDGRRWIQDSKGVRVKEHIKRELSAIVMAAKAGGDMDAAKEALNYLSNNKVNAILSLVESDPLVLTKLDAFDQLSSVLNLQNGQLDLATRQLMPHDSSDLLSKLANVEFDPDADCPNFKKVLLRALLEPHAEFLLSYLGYALLGDPREQVFAILHGPGANGKSTLINAVAHLFGDYAANVETTTLIKSKTERIRTDVARLNGIHLAVTSELAMGQVLDAPLIKRFSGGDTITARKLYGEETEYKPKFTLVMTTNALPVIDGADMALARRLILLPFSNVVPADQRDPNLGRALELEAPGILNMLLEGLRQYQVNGLNIPSDLADEASEFVQSSDMVAAFISEKTEEANDAQVGAAELFLHYRTWCSMSGLKSLSAPQFRQELMKKGFQQKRTNTCNAWWGLRLRLSNI